MARCLAFCDGAGEKAGLAVGPAGEHLKLNAAFDACLRFERTRRDEFTAGGEVAGAEARLLTPHGRRGWRIDRLTVRMMAEKRGVGTIKRRAGI